MDCHVWVLFTLALAGSCEALKFLQITDFHLDVDYALNGDSSKMCHSSSINSDSKLGVYGDYKCDSPESLVKYIVQEAKRTIPNPDLILWTGDNVPHVDGYDMDYVLNALNKTSTILFSAFPTTTILPTFGNHDYAPANAFVPDSNLYEKIFDGLWSDKIQSTQKSFFYKGGYYSYRLPNSNQLIVVLNTNLYYEANAAADNFSNPYDPADQFSYLENTLSVAERCARIGATDCVRTVHIAAHIGPGVFERTPKMIWFRPYYNERFLNILEKYYQNVGWIIVGHHHTDTFHVTRDYAGIPRNVVWMAPAVTPWFSSLPGAGANNPAFRVYDIDGASGMINDFTTYWIDLSKLNKDSTQKTTIEYSMKEAYGLSSLSASEISDLVDTFEKNDNLFLKYIGFNSVGYDVQLPKDEFRLAQLCSMKFADYIRYFECINQSTQTQTTTPNPAQSLNAFLSFMLSVLLMLNAF